MNELTDTEALKYVLELCDEVDREGGNINPKALRTYLHARNQTARDTPRYDWTYCEAMKIWE